MTDGDRSPLLSDYPDHVRMPVQWGDQDAFGHVNNTVFLRWFENGRISYLTRVGMTHDIGEATVAPILAALTCSFRKQLTYPDTIIIGTRVSRMGNSSMQMEHAIASEVRGEIVADGTSTVVHFDYQAGKSCTIPDALRRSINELEATRRG